MFAIQQKVSEKFFFWRMCLYQYFDHIRQMCKLMGGGYVNLNVNHLQSDYRDLKQHQ